MRLKRYHLATGAISNSIVSLDSNGFAASSSFQTRLKCFSHQFDFDNFAYFIEAQLTKSALRGTPALGAIKLGSCEP